MRWTITPLPPARHDCEGRRSPVRVTRRSSRGRGESPAAMTPRLPIDGNVAHVAGVPPRPSKRGSAQCQYGRVRCGVGSPMPASRTSCSSSPASWPATRRQTASDATWIARYTGHSEQARHLATAFLLLLAGLALMTFLVALWRRIAEADPTSSPSRLPIAAAGPPRPMGAGGMVMGYISGSELLGHYPLPSADLLRMSNDLGFALAGIAGSWAAAVAVATLSVQGHAAGVFGAKMRAAGIITALLLLLSMFFYRSSPCSPGYSPPPSSGSATQHLSHPSEASATRRPATRF